MDQIPLSRSPQDNDTGANGVVKIYSTLRDYPFKKQEELILANLEKMGDASAIARWKKHTEEHKAKMAEIDLAFSLNEMKKNQAKELLSLHDRECCDLVDEKREQLAKRMDAVNFFSALGDPRFL